MNIAVKTTLALVASLAVNVAVIGSLDWSVHLAQTAPEGTVVVKQLPDELVQAAYAHAGPGTARAVAKL